MFGFDDEEAAALGSEGRFEERYFLFKEDGRRLPFLRHYGWWLLHNIVAHVCLGLLPFGPFFRFHDWTSTKLGHGEG